MLCLLLLFHSNEGSGKIYIERERDWAIRITIHASLKCDPMHSLRIVCAVLLNVCSCVSFRWIWTKGSLLLMRFSEERKNKNMTKWNETKQNAHTYTHTTVTTTENSLQIYKYSHTWVSNDNERQCLNMKRKHYEHFGLLCVCVSLSRSVFLLIPLNSIP